MKEYILLQFKMANRKLTEFGTPPLLAYPLLALFFFGLSFYLFSKTEFAEYFYILFTWGLLTKLTNKRRNEFLQSCFTKNDYRKIRLLENLILILPFALFLIYENSIVLILILLVLAIIHIFVNVKTTFHLTIPTPFHKKPFEFAVGFRNTFFIFPIAYFLTYISISVDNLNLGIFSMLLVFLVCLSFYSKLENEYYVWSFNLSPKDFLTAKIKTGVFYATFLSLPILIALSIYFSAEIEVILSFQILGYVYLLTMILAKYSVYPNEMNITQGLLVASSFIFPPILIGITPYFYFQSTRRLKAIL